jgi:hypothetical protein
MDFAIESGPISSLTVSSRSIDRPNVALVVECIPGLPERQPAEFVFGLGCQFVSKLCQEERGPHPVMPVLISSMEELRGLADSLDDCDPHGQFLSDFTHDRLLTGFPRQRTAAGKPVAARRSPDDGNRSALSKDNCIGSSPLDIDLAMSANTEMRSLRWQFAHGEHHLQRIGIGQSVIATDLDQHGAAVCRQFFRVSERDHIIRPTVKKHRTRLHHSGRSPVLPFGAEQDELCEAAVDVHGHGPATGASHDDLRLMLIEFGLGRRNRRDEVIIVECRIDDVVAMVLQVRRLDATRNRVPAMKEEDFQRQLFLATIRQRARLWPEGNGINGVANGINGAMATCSATPYSAVIVGMMMSS